MTVKYAMRQITAFDKLIAQQLTCFSYVLNIFRDSGNDIVLLRKTKLKRSSLAVRFALNYGISLEVFQL